MKQFIRFLALLITGSCLLLGATGLALVLRAGSRLRPQPTTLGAPALRATMDAAGGSNDTPEPATQAAGSGSEEPVPQGKIVYTCQIFGDSHLDQICLVNADGSGFVRLTQDDGVDYGYPSLAPDGQSVLYSGNESGDFEIYEMGLEDKAEARQLTSGLGDAFAPAVSPDGRQVLFYRNTGEQDSLWLMNRDGSDPHQLFAPPQGNGWDPVWSPDGSQILFASDKAGGVQLFVITPAGTGLRQVSHIDGIRGRNDWSPDGQTIATYVGAAWQREIFLMDLNGDNLRQVTQGGNNLAPSFSPDGEWIAFTSYRDNFNDPNGCEIYTMRKDGSQVTRLTFNKTCDWQPRWGQ